MDLVLVQQENIAGAAVGAGLVLGSPWPPEVPQCSVRSGCSASLHTPATPANYGQRVGGASSRGLLGHLDSSRREGGGGGRPLQGREASPGGLPPCAFWEQSPGPCHCGGGCGSGWPSRAQAWGHGCCQGLHPWRCQLPGGRPPWGDLRAAGTSRAGKHPATGTWLRPLESIVPEVRVDLTSLSLRPERRLSAGQEPPGLQSCHAGKSSRPAPRSGDGSSLPGTL